MTAVCLTFISVLGNTGSRTNRLALKSLFSQLTSCGNHFSMTSLSFLICQIGNKNTPQIPNNHLGQLWESNDIRYVNCLAWGLPDKNPNSLLLLFYIHLMYSIQYIIPYTNNAFYILVLIFFKKLQKRWC